MTDPVANRRAALYRMLAISGIGLGLAILVVGAPRGLPFILTGFGVLALGVLVVIGFARWRRHQGRKPRS